MARKKTQMDRAIDQIDSEIAVLQATRDRMVAARDSVARKPKVVKPARTAAAGAGTRKEQDVPLPGVGELVGAR